MLTMSQINHIKDLSNCGYRISEIWIFLCGRFFRTRISTMAICPEDRYQSTEEMERALLIGNDGVEQIKRVLMAEGAASLVLALAAVLTGL